MSGLPKDVLVDGESDGDKIEQCSAEKLSTSSSTKGVPHRSGTKRTRTICSSTNHSKCKRRKSTTEKCSNEDNRRDPGVGTAGDVGSGSDLAVPLTRGDIPTIVSAVLQSIRSPDLPGDNELESPTIPG